MSSFLIRPLLFIFILSLGLWAGWEFILAFFIFSVAVGNYYWEYIFLGFFLDLIFNFPMGLFTVIFTLIFAAAYFSHDFFKSDSVFLNSLRILIFTILAIFIYSIFYYYIHWPGFDGAVIFFMSSLIKVLTASLLILLLSNIANPFLAAQKIR